MAYVLLIFDILILTKLQFKILSIFSAFFYGIMFFYGKRKKT